MECVAEQAYIQNLRRKWNSQPNETFLTLMNLEQKNTAFIRMVKKRFQMLVDDWLNFENIFERAILIGKVDLFH